MTNLPASEEAYLRNIPESTPSFHQAINGQGMLSLSSISVGLLVSSLLGRTISHAHRPETYHDGYTLSGKFWDRHKFNDNMIARFFPSLPGYFRLPAGIGDSNIIFSNICIHGCTIILHQSAALKAEEEKLPGQIIAESKRKCLDAAYQISNILETTTFADIATVSV